MKRVWYCVQWVGLAPLGHAAYKAAYEVNPNTFRLEFPANTPSVISDKAVQHGWAQETARHLRSWGIQAQVFEMPEKPSRPVDPWTGRDEQWSTDCADRIVGRWCEDESLDTRELARQYVGRAYGPNKANRMVDRVVGKVAKLVAVLSK